MHEPHPDPARENLLQLTQGISRRLFSSIEHLVPPSDRERILERFREVVASDVRRYEAGKKVRFDGPQGVPPRKGGRP